jgi:hypothetical protein
MCVKAVLPGRKNGLFFSFGILLHEKEIVMERLYVFDTTLRDGEQSPGASMSVEQKYEVALQLATLGVDAIETGFPVSSPIQWKACELIAKT